ncbi:MAG: LamG domain-containing protein, partial [Thermoplasmata archaeon]|nr:LamG domain-containing protein [Thermoplasmata archaeon]
NNGNDGTPYGSMNKDVTGKVDGADEFDGVDDYVDCGNAASFDITDEITVEAWVKRGAISSGDETIAGKYVTGTNERVWLIIFNNYNNVRFFVSKDGTTTGRSDITTTKTYTSTTDWYHVVAVYDYVTDGTSIMKIYVDGDEKASTSSAVGDLHVNSEIVEIGSYNNGGGGNFNGTIDEVRISGVARSAEWISTTFNNENSPGTFYSVGSEEAIVRGVEVIIEPDNQPGVIGENVVFTVTVKNTGNVWDNYKLENNDDAGWTLKLDNDYLEIPWNENRETKLTVFVPDNENLVCTTDNITVVATAVDNAEVTDNDNATVHAVPSWMGTAVFSLVNLYTLNVEKILDLNQGSKLVVKFYTYGDAFENENVIETFVPTAHVEENENARHPGGTGVKKARLVLTTDDTSNEISTIATWTTTKSVLIARISQIKSRWPFADAAEKSALIAEISIIKGQWPFAPF